MKKMINLIIIGLFLISGLGTITISQKNIERIETTTIHFSEPSIKESNSYTTIDLLETTDNFIEYVKPEIPMITKVYTFPLGTTIKNVNVNYGAEISYKINKPIKLAPEPQITSTVYESTYEYSEVTPEYNDINIYPEESYNFRTGAGLKDEEHVIYLTVHLYPIKYQPSKSIIIYSTEATIDITYIPPEKPMIFPDVYDLLIITPSQFTDQLQPLVDYKNEHDIKTVLVTLDEIPSTGRDKQEDIKYYIKDAIETWGITNLLLVGAGVEGEELFPVRDAWVPSGSYEQFFPSDLYYADIYDSNMNFSSWDANDNGLYAEYYNNNDAPDKSAIDIYPDVCLGKLPCNNAAELKIIVDKIINYEEHNKMVKRIVQLGGDTFPGDPEGIYEGEFCNAAVLNNLPGYSSIQLWGTNGKLTKQDIKKAFNEGVDFVDCSGHGSWASWATHAPDNEGKWIPSKTLIPYSPYTGLLYIDLDLFLYLNSKKLPVVVFNACSCSKYSESPNCISWSMLRKSGAGGIASFGASGIGYGSYGRSETERLWGWMEVNILKELYNTKNLGQVWSSSITDYANSFELDDGDYKTLLEMAMFGDPTLNIEDGINPEDITNKIPVFHSLFDRIIDRLNIN